MSSPKILVIEDDVQVQAMLERYLVGLGYRVVHANDGIEGIRVFSTERPDLVLLDMLLPKLLGTDVCDMMKRSVEGASIPIVMMSAVMKPDHLQKDLRGKRRPDAYLVKPFQFSEMARVVSALLEGRHVDEEPLEEGLEVLEIIDRGGSSVYALSEAGLFDASKAYAPFAAIVGEGSAARTSPPVAVSGPTTPTPPSMKAQPSPPLGDVLDIAIEYQPAPAHVGVATTPAPATSGPPRPATAAATRGGRTQAPTRPPPPIRASDAGSSPRSSSPQAIIAMPPPDAITLSPAQAVSPAAPAQAAFDSFSVNRPLPPDQPPRADGAGATTDRRARPEGGASPRVVVMQMANESAAAPGNATEFDDLLEDVRRVLDDEPSGPQDEVVVDVARASPQGASGNRTSAPGAAILSFPSVAPPLPGAPAAPEERGLGRMTPKVPGPGLRDTTFPELLLLLFRRIFSGLVRLEREDGRKEVFFLNGYPVHVASDLRVESLGRQLVRMGRISEDVYLQSLKLMEEKRAHAAEALVEIGALSAHDLSPILRALERENLLRTFGWDGATYELERGAERVARVPIFEMNPIALVAQGLAEWTTQRQLDAEVGAFGDRFVRATPDFTKHHAEVGPYLPDVALEPALDGSRRVVDLVALGAAAGYDAPSMLLAIKTMRTLGMVELVEGATAHPAPHTLEWGEGSGAALPSVPVARAPQKSDAPIDAIPVDRVLEERVLRTYLTIKGQNHFELLGVPMGARAEEIDRAYAEGAKAFHPDLIQFVSDSDVRSKAKEIFMMMGEAYEVLRDTARRAAYIEALGQEPASAPTEGIAVAEQEFRKGERFVQQGNWANAQVAFTNALRLNAKEPEYYLMLGWAMYQNYRTSGNEAAINRAVGFIRKVIVLNPQDDRAFYYLGSVYRDRGQADLARQLFQRALKYNPQNRDAQAALDALG